MDFTSGCEWDGKYFLPHDRKRERERGGEETTVLFALNVIASKKHLYNHVIKMSQLKLTFLPKLLFWHSMVFCKVSAYLLIKVKVSSLKMIYCGANTTYLIRQCRVICLFICFDSVLQGIVYTEPYVKMYSITESQVSTQTFSVISGDLVAKIHLSYTSEQHNIIRLWHKPYPYKH